MILTSRTLKKRNVAGVFFRSCFLPTFICGFASFVADLKYLVSVLHTPLKRIVQTHSKYCELQLCKTLALEMSRSHRVGEIEFDI